MSCAINFGFEECNYSLGGTKRFFIGNLSDLSSVSYDELERITAATISTIYEIEEPYKFAEVNEEMSNSDNGFFVNQSIQLQLGKKEYLKRYWINELKHADLFVIVYDGNSKLHLFGETNGLRLTTSNSGIGKVGGDFNGFNVNLQGVEKYYAREMTIGLDAILSATPNYVAYACGDYASLTWGSDDDPAYWNQLADCTYSTFS